MVPWAAKKRKQSVRAFWRRPNQPFCLSPAGLVVLVWICKARPSSSKPRYGGTKTRSGRRMREFIAKDNPSKSKSFAYVASTAQSTKLFWIARNERRIRMKKSCVFLLDATTIPSSSQNLRHEAPYSSIAHFHYIWTFLRLFCYYPSYYQSILVMPTYTLVLSLIFVGILVLMYFYFKSN